MNMIIEESIPKKRATASATALNVLHLAPPLTISKKDMSMITDILKKSIKKITINV